MAIHPQLDLVHKAICAGIMCQIEWKDAAAQLVRDDPQLEGFLPAGIRARLRQFVLDGGVLDVRQETRIEYLAECPEDPFWYRAVLTIPGKSFRLFVEVKLIEGDPEEPWVQIVSA